MFYWNVGMMEQWNNEKKDTEKRITKAPAFAKATAGQAKVRNHEKINRRLRRLSQMKCRDRLSPRYAGFSMLRHWEIWRTQ